MKPGPDENRSEATPVRISKLLAERGICSRREADDFISRGLVIVDHGHVAQLGEKVLPSQTLTLDPRARGELGEQVTILLHKPLGYVSGQAEDGYTPAAALIGPETHYEGDRSGIVYSPRQREGLAPAGRLDIDSTGLLVLTQNGTIARQLIGNDTKIDKEYVVGISGKLSREGLALLNHGLELDGKKLRPATVTLERGDQLRFILREGRKRQIRRMCTLVGIGVVSLKRIRIGKVTLGDLPYGKWRYLGPKERF
jgi:23S rRNA pseudouridine2604 synthase